MLKLKLQYFGHLMWRVDSLEKTDAGRDWGQGEKGTPEDEMAGWHHWLDGRESEWTPGDGDGQGGLVCCDSWGRKVSDTTERLIWSDLIYIFKIEMEYFTCCFFKIFFSYTIYLGQSVQLSCSVVSDSLWPHGLQHTRLPRPPSPRACSNSCPLIPLHHPTISSSVIPFSSWPQSFPASIRFLLNESALRIRWPKYWNFSYR